MGAFSQLFIYTKVKPQLKIKLVPASCFLRNFLTQVADLAKDGRSGGAGANAPTKLKIWRYSPHD